jgi:hypothetical protein
MYFIVSITKFAKVTINKIIKKLLIAGGMNNLPDFLIIGAQKAGTVPLLRYLQQHPELIGANKEIGFFSTNNYYNGIKWYKKQLPIRIDKKKLIFEKTPEYIYYPETPKRIQKNNKNIKLILIIRNPVKRAFSGWNHYKKYYYSWENYSKEKLMKRVNRNLGFEKSKHMIDFLNEPEYKDFYECIIEEIELINKDIFRYFPSFVRRGIYYEQIKNYMKYFDKKQILIIESSDLRNKKEEVLNNVTDFLEISSFDFSNINLKEIHKSNYKGSKIDEKSEKILKEFYKPYNEKLFEIIGKKYKWN